MSQSDTSASPEPERSQGLRQKKKANTVANFGILFTFLAVIGLVATPAIDSAVVQEQQDAVLSLQGALRLACENHHRDTGRYAIEFAAPDAEHSYRRSRYHHLGAQQLYPGWKGPYLPQGLSRADNPFGGDVQLRADLAESPALGFMIADRLQRGAGQYLVLTQVPLKFAQGIDERIDSGIQSSAASKAWQQHGRVEYSEDLDGGTLVIFLFSASIP